MRKLSACLRAKIKQRLGLEPVLAVAVDWTGTGEVYYFDRALDTKAAGLITGASYGDDTGTPLLDGSIHGNGWLSVAGVVPDGVYPGKVLEVGGVDDVQQVAGSGSGSSGSVSVKLDDTDGTIRAVMRGVDVHKRTVRLYQMFSGCTDRFLLYEGQINSPITWSEGERTLAFTCVTIVEDLEVGFSAEEGQFPNLPDDAIGKVWPMAFGNVKRVPGLTFQVVPVGQIMTNIVVPDRTYQLVIMSMMRMSAQFEDGLYLAFFYQAMAHYAGDFDAEDAWAQRAQEIQEHNNEIKKEILEKSLELERWEIKYRENELNVEGQAVGPLTQGYTILSNDAKWFPRNVPFYARCGNFLLHGTVDNNAVFRFQIIQPPVPTMWPWTDTDSSTGQQTSGVGWIVPSWSESDMYVGFDNVVHPVFGGTPTYGPHGCWIQPGYQWADSIDAEGFRIIPAGTTIQIVSDVTMDYIVNIAPVKSVDTVWAWRQTENVVSLQVVPTSYYEVITTKYPDTRSDTKGGKVVATVVRLRRPLSGYAFQGWQDQIYADMTCGVPGQIGPIMEYLIGQYTNRTIDPDSWKPGGSATDDCSFWLYKRGNILGVLSEMAYQTRHAVFLKNGKFGLKYLPAEDDSVMRFTEDDVVAGTMEISCTETEELITKIKGHFKYDYSIENAVGTVIVKSNDLIWGIRIQEDEYYVYTHTESVMKSCTFWAVRKSNTWKKLKFKTMLTALGLETFDTVTLAFREPWVANGSVRGLVENCAYDPADNSVSVSLWLPVTFGDTKEHPLFWSATASESEFFPYIPTGVSPQPKPAFYAGDISGLIPNVVGMAPQTKIVYNWPDRTKTKEQSLTSSGESNPSDTGDEGPQDDPKPAPWAPPRVIESTKGNFDQMYRKKGLLPVDIPTRSPVPGEVQGNDKDVYVVDLYPYGLGGKKFTVSDVKQLQIAAGRPIPKGTWVLVSRVRDKKQKVHHYMQAPVWMA